MKRAQFFCFFLIAMLVGIHFSVHNPTSETETKHSTQTPISSDDDDFWYRFCKPDESCYSFPKFLLCNENSIYTGIKGYGVDICISYSFQTRAYLSRWNTSGGMLWYKSVFFGSWELQMDICSCWVNSTHILVCGQEQMKGMGFNLRDFDGNSIWYKYVPNSSVYEMVGDNDFLYTYGKVKVPPYSEPYQYAMMLAKWDLNGNHVWNRTWTIWNDYGEGDVSINNDSIYLTHTKVDGQLLYPHLMKWSKNGDLLWNISLITENNDVINDLTSDNDSIYLSGNSDMRSLIMKIDEDGSLVWKKIGENRTFFYDSVILEDSVYVCGYSKPFSWGSYDTYIVSFSLDGTQKWSKEWGKFNESERTTAITTNGLNIYTLGQVSKNSEFILDSQLIKWGMDGGCINFSSISTPTLNLTQRSLTWNLIPDATKYYVFRSEVPFQNVTELVPVDSTSETVFVLPDLKYSAYYAIAAANHTVISEISNLIYIEGVPKIIPGVPIWGMLLVGFLSICVILKINRTYNEIVTMRQFLGSFAASIVFTFF